MGGNGEEKIIITKKDEKTTINIPKTINEEGASKVADSSVLEIIIGAITLDLSNNGNTPRVVISTDRRGDNEDPSVRIYSKADPNYSLAVLDGEVILADTNPSDPLQHWIKHDSTEVKDEQGFPSFALVNKATGEAIKNSVGNRDPVQLTPYVPDKLDESILWTQSSDLGDSYTKIRKVDNICLVFEAFIGFRRHGNVRDGTEIVLREQAVGDNQLWRIDPFTTNKDGRPSITLVENSVLEITIGAIMINLSNNGSTLKIVIDGKGTGGGSSKDDSTISKIEELVKSLQEQIKSQQEQIISLLHRILG